MDTSQTINSRQAKRLVRVYYHLEDAGWQRLEDLKREYFATYHSIQQVLNNDFAEDDADE